AGPVRASSRSTKCGPSSVHRMLPTWQSPCRRSVRCSKKRSATLSSASPETLSQTSARSGGISSESSSQSRGPSPKVSMVKRGASLEAAGRADRVDAAEEAADPFQRLVVLQLGRAPAAARIHAEAEISERVQRPLAYRHGRNHRDFPFRHLDRKRMVFEDLRV